MGPGLGEALSLAALAVGGKVGVLHQRGALARENGDVVAVQLERINNIGVVRMDFHRSEKVCASGLGCCRHRRKRRRRFRGLLFPGIIDIDCLWSRDR